MLAPEGEWSTQLHPRALNDRVRYPRRYVASLVDGFVELPVTGEVYDTAHWMELRSYIERTGDVESEAFATVIDFERALVALQRHHPQAAVIIATVTLLDIDGYDLYRIFGGRTNWLRLQTKGVAWMSTYLSGKDLEACEQSYRKAR